MNKVLACRLFVIGGLIAAQFVIPSPASACSCVYPGTPAEQYSVSAAVFAGEVTGVSNNYNPIISIFARVLAELGQYPSFLYTYRFSGYDVTFNVQTSWKGISTTHITLSTGSGGGDCGYSFITGNTYLVYAWQSDSFDHLSAGICSRTNELTVAAEDLSYLNTLPTITLTPVFDYSWLCWAAPLLFVCIVGILVGMARQRKRNLNTDINE